MYPSRRLRVGPNLVVVSASESASDMHGTKVVFVFVPALVRSTGGSDVC